MMVGACHVRDALQLQRERGKVDRAVAGGREARETQMQQQKAMEKAQAALAKQHIK